MRSEDRLRARCRMYLDMALPEPGYFSAIEHGRKHSGSQRARMLEWSRLKGQGVKNGLADVMVWFKGRFIGIELKVGKNKTSESQDAFANAMQANGFAYHVVRSVVDLHDTLLEAGIPIRPSMRLAAENHDAALQAEEAPKKRTYKPKGDRPSSASIRRVERMRKETMF